LLRQPRLDVPLSSSLIFYTQQLAFQIFSANPHPVFGATENARLENPAPNRRGGKRRNKLYGQPIGQFLQFIEITVSL